MITAIRNGRAQFGARESLLTTVFFVSMVSGILLALDDPLDFWDCD